LGGFTTDAGEGRGWGTGVGRQRRGGQGVDVTDRRGERMGKGRRPKDMQKLDEAAPCLSFRRPLFFFSPYFPVPLPLPCRGSALLPTPLPSRPPFPPYRSPSFSLS